MQIWEASRPPPQPRRGQAKGSLSTQAGGWDEFIHNRGTTSLFLPPSLLGNNPRIDHRLHEFFTQKISECLLHELGLQFNTSTDKKWSLHNDWRSTTPRCSYPTVTLLLSPPPTKRCCKNQKSENTVLDDFFCIIISGHWSHTSILLCSTA